MFKKIVSNTLSQILSKVGTAIISIFLIGILTKYLPMHLYGLYNKIYNYLGIFAFLADLGLYTIAIREITNNKKQASKIVGNILTLRFSLGIIILFLALGLAYILPGYNSSIALISIFVVSIFTIISLLNSAILALMQSYMKIEFSLFSVILGKLLNIIIVILIIFIFFPKNLIKDFNQSFIFIMIAGLSGIILNTFLNYLYARKIIQIKFNFDFNYIKHILKISLPYGIALFLSVVYFKVDIILLSILELQNKADTSIALYSLPMKIIEVLMVIGGFYLNSILPSLTKYYKNKDNKSLNNLLNISFKILFSFGILVFVIGVLFKDYIIEIIANKDYINSSLTYSSSDVFPIVLGVLVFYFISLIFIYSLIVIKKQSLLLKINIIITIFNIIGNIILIPKYSFIGAGITTLVSQILLMLLSYFYTNKYIKIKTPFLYIFKVIILGVFIYILGLFLLNNYSIGLYIDIFLYGLLLLIIYLLFTYIFLNKKFIYK